MSTEGITEQQSKGGKGWEEGRQGGKKRGNMEDTEKEKEWE